MNLRYPIGMYKKPLEITSKTVEDNIATLEKFPILLRNELKNISSTQLETSYREGGWTIAQVIHHCADSHLNAYIRSKWTLTENTPTIKAYNEVLWADLPDANAQFEITHSLNIIEGIHNRWVFMLRNIDSKSFKKKFYHPETEKEVSLEELTCLYAWHSLHHLAHIQLVTRK